jgi:hypothetical protein
MAACNLLPPAERKARQETKQLAALRFLSQVIYSTPEIIGRAMGLQTSAWYRALHQLEREELIMRAEIDLGIPGGGRKFALWGITPHGQGMAHALCGVPISNRCFRPTEVSVSTLLHFLGLQKLQLAAERASWTAWTYSDLGAFYGPINRPDAIARSSKGYLFAIEYERTLKNPRRYQEILGAHLNAIRGGKVTGAIWVAPGEAMLGTLREHILRVEEVPPLVKGMSKLKVNPAQDHKYLYFLTETSFPFPQDHQAPKAPPVVKVPMAQAG